MILSETTIQTLLDRGAIIHPFDPALLKPASYTFRLGPTLRKLQPGNTLVMGQKPHYDTITLPEYGYLLQPGEFIVDETLERLTLNETFACILSTRGSIGQLGLDALQTDFFAEPRTDNTLLLGLANNSSLPIRLLPGRPIVKGIFFEIK